MYGLGYLKFTHEIKKVEKSKKKKNSYLLP